MLPWMRKPTANPIAVVTTTLQASRPVSASGSPGEHGAAGDGQRAEPVEEALLDVLGDAGRRAGAGEQHRS